VDSFVGQVDGKPVKYRPQHLFGIAVDSGKRTILNLTVHPGEGLEEIGKPVVRSENAVSVADEILDIRQQLTELAGVRKDLDEIRKESTAAKRK